MKTTERTVLGIESLEELLEGWDHIRSNRKMLRGPLILPNYFMEVDGESSIAETLARLVDNLSKDSVLMSFQGRVKSFAYYLPYTAPGESDFPGLRTFDAIYKKNLCRFGMPFEGVIAIDITEWILAKATKSEKFLAFLAYIATIAIPWQVYMLPQYVMMQRMHLIDTHLSIILLQSFTAFGVFLLRQFYITIPDELLEAARIDGLSEYGTFARIVLPLTKPAMATLTIMSFVTVWNDYMGPMIYFNSDRLKTIQLGIQLFVGQYSAEYGLIMATSVMAIIPVLIVFLAFQRFFVEGIASSGLKG